MVLANVPIPSPSPGEEPSPPGTPEPAPTEPSPSPGEEPSPPPEEPPEEEPPEPEPPEPEDDSGGGGLDCDFTDVSCHISDWFGDLVRDSLNPMFAAIGEWAFSTPEPSESVIELWGGTLTVANVLYVLLIMAAGIIVMAHETLQSQYSAREIAPRLVVGFVAANFSLWVATEMIRFGNDVAAAISSTILDPQDAAQDLHDRLEVIAVDEVVIWVVLLLVAIVVLLVIWLLVEVVRVVMSITLVIFAPLMLMFHALPHSQRIASLWWRSMAAVVTIPILQAVAFTALVDIFFNEHLLSFGPPAEEEDRTGEVDILYNLLLFVTMLYIQIRIPFWVLGLVRSGSIGPSPAARILKTAANIIVFRRVLGSMVGRKSTSGASERSGSGRNAKSGNSRPKSKGTSAQRGAPQTQPSQRSSTGRSASAPSPQASSSSTHHRASHTKSTFVRRVWDRVRPRSARDTSRPERGHRTPRGKASPLHDSPGGRRPRDQEGARPDSSSSSRQDGSRGAVQLGLFPPAKRFRQGVLPTPPPTRVPGRTTPTRLGEVWDNPRPAPPARPQRGQISLFKPPRRPRWVQRPLPFPRNTKDEGDQ